MAIEFDDSEWFPTINFFKKSENWQMILEEAGEIVAEEAAERAKEILYGGPPDNNNMISGSVGESIEYFAAPEGDRVSIGLQSDHPAANMIEYGGLVPTGNHKKTFAVDDFADNVWAVSNKIKSNQPFRSPRPFLRPAMDEAVGQLNAEISAVARMYADDL